MTYDEALQLVIDAALQTWASDTRNETLKHAIQHVCEQLPQRDAWGRTDRDLERDYGGPVRHHLPQRDYSCESGDHPVSTCR